MRQTLNWIGSNLSTLFSLIGVVLTIAFSVFYIPGYIAEAKNEKINTVNADMIEIIEEVLYSEQSIDVNYINSIIRGKEFKYNIQYPYTISELLDQVNEDFMSNNFIPLEKKVAVSQIMESLKTTDIQNDSIESQDIISQVNKKKNWDYFKLIPVFIAILGVLLAFWGLWGTFLNAQRDILETSQDSEERLKEKLLDISSSAYKFEKEIELIINEMGISYQYSMSEDGSRYDLIVGTSNNQYIVEIIYSRKPVDKRTLSSRINKFKSLKANGLIISSRALSTQAMRYLRKTNSDNVDRSDIKLIEYENRDVLKNKLKEIFKVA